MQLSHGDKIATMETLDTLGVVKQVSDANGFYVWQVLDESRLPRWCRKYRQGSDVRISKTAKG